MQLNKIFSLLPQTYFSGLRSICLTAVHFDGNIDDPVQRLFLEKLKEYKQRSADGKMIEPTPEIEQELKSELERINRQYGGDGKTDLKKFPEFEFPEVNIDPITNEVKEESK